MHASRAQPVQRDGIGAASAGTTSLAFTNSGNNIDMKYVQLISAGDQASTSYAASPRVMTTAFQTGQDTYPNAQLVTTADGSSVIEYLIDSRDFDVNTLGQTVYLEMVPNMLSNGGSNDDEPQLNAEEVMAIENDYLNSVYSSQPTSSTTTPAKKSRYSRMTAAERDRYNARRRQRRLEKKQIKAENEQAQNGTTNTALLMAISTSQPQQTITIPAPVVQVVAPQSIMVEPKPEVKAEEPEELVFTEDIGSTDVKQEGDDNRYQDINDRDQRYFTQKRNSNSTFRKQRDEEDDSHIFSSDSSDHQLINSSMDDTALAQMLTARNARRAEKARQRYQRMTVEERRNYNHRRTMAKKARKQLAAAVSASSTPVKSESQSEAGQQILPPSAPESADLNQQVLSILQQSAMQAEMQKQQQHQQTQQQNLQQPFSSIDDTIEQVAAYGNYQPTNNQVQVIQVPKVEPTEQVVQEYAEPATLPLVFIDQHGNPAQLPEGSVIEVRQEHPNGPQTIIIHTATQSQPQLAPPQPSAPLPQSSQTRFIPPPQPTPQAAVVQLITQVSAPSAPTSTTPFISDPLQPLDSESSETGTAPGSTISESEISRNEDLRAKRAARARERYHNMSEADRRMFNARRASALRRARVRDEELCRIGEEARNTGMVLDEETNKAVVDALQRRAKRAESARLKYQRMTMEERRIYNANRDANRKAKKRETPSEPDETIISDSVETSVKDEPVDFSFT
uniref:BZIP domain-containing protein n=1 Tax=Panagrellus redivivus TaxID=6233 RepID=A0A7E4W0X5_PANRE